MKFFRDDFWYWLPVRGRLEIFTSLVFRSIVKVIADFTSIVHFRHPQEIGGIQWSLRLVLTIASLPVTIWMYGKEVGQDELYHEARTATFILLPAFVTILLVFFMTIDKNYLATFVSPQRGKDMVVRKFRDSLEDGTKAKTIFKKSRHQWKSIEEEVRGLLEEK